MHDQFAQPPCHGGSVLQPVPGKAGRDDEIFEFVDPRADTGLAVHAVLVVVAAPAACVFFEAEDVVGAERGDGVLGGL